MTHHVANAVAAQVNSLVAVRKRDDITFHFGDTQPVIVRMQVHRNMELMLDGVRGGQMVDTTDADSASTAVVNPVVPDT